MNDNKQSKIFSKQEWEDLKIKARREIGFHTIKENSHNLIGICMMGMDDYQMRQFASQLNLRKLGWNHLDDGRIKITDDDKRKNEIAYELRRRRCELIYETE